MLFRMGTVVKAQSWTPAHCDKTPGHPFDMLISCDHALCEKLGPSYFVHARGRCEGCCGHGQTDNLHVAQSHRLYIGIARRLGIATCGIDLHRDQSEQGCLLEMEPSMPTTIFAGGRKWPTLSRLVHDDRCRNAVRSAQVFGLPSLERAQRDDGRSSL